MSNFAPFSDNPLNSMNTLELLQRLEKYKKVDLKRISQSDLFDLTLTTLPILNICSRNINMGTKLFRVRRKRAGMLFESKLDAWYPDPKYVTEMQRLNDIGEPMLYTSFDQATPFYESKAATGDSFALFEYEVKKDHIIQATSIGMNDGVLGGMLNEQGIINDKIIEQFLHTEFTKEVGSGTEYLYRISNMLAKNFYDIPNCDGYMYPSVAIGSGINVAIKPKSVDEKLLLNSVTNVIVINLTLDSNVEVSIESRSTSIEAEGRINY
ncbi:hypothetical protein MKX41_02400 [Paenibacillus sp. FSL R5-0475]|uniref:hypothetical protein n=1 Tax=Paenibacillus sp. FSL R5-0475 TaxID=2921643 RepID=UPI0030F71935